MQPMLSFDDAPPFSVPTRFFLTAPWHGVLAGLLILIEGDALTLSRWSPAVLALTHLVTVGVLMQVMIGALFQFLPVAAGVGIARPRLVATVVHVALNGGVLSLAGGFYFGSAPGLQLAAILLTVAVVLFLIAALAGLLLRPHTSPTIPALKLALLGLLVTLGIGLTLLATLIYGGPGKLVMLTAQHAAWGLIGWSASLLAGVAYVVVPMFQLTPAYSRRTSRALVPGLFSLLVLWSVVQIAGAALPIALIATLLAAVLAAFATLTLRLQAASRRAVADSTIRYWRSGMWVVLLCATVWVVQSWAAVLGADHTDRFAFGLGVLSTFGVLVAVISGMLYKILPFLCWLSLQSVGLQLGIARTPHMGIFLDEAAARRQYLAHHAALLFLLGGLFWSALLRPAGVLVVLAFLGLAFNLLRAVRTRQREHRQLIATAAA